MSFSPIDKCVYMRELCGHDEVSVNATDTLVAIQLLDRILVTTPGTKLGQGNAQELTTHDRDRLLIAIYQRTFGDRIESTLSCNGCGSLFDLNFTLDELLGRLETKTQDGLSVEGNIVVFRLPSGLQFRLPTGEDETAVLGLTSEEAETALVEKCLIDNDATTAHNWDDLQDAMGKVAPILDMDLNAQCPECNQDQSIHFNLQHYLLTSIMQERLQLNRDVHCLAITYGWGLDEILKIPRSQRRTYVELVGS